ncbi:MAG: FAD-dependent oxidoreductase, partial [Chromatiales bacterium]|nr:FAD-dependent oxidoreductase [Chromatiales bacterium]
MPETIDILVPDIGDFSEVEVVEIHIGPGSVVDIETPLVTLESDKASIDVPSPAAGTVATLTVSMGDHISQGTRICTLTVSNPPAADAAREPDAEAMVSASAAPTDVGAYDGDPIVETQVLVIGAGPGGYTAAFRSADLGQRTTLVERYETLGGVCLNVGCIPSKALLHTADVMRSVEAMASHGVTYGAPTIDLPALRDWKGSVAGKLTKGLAGLAKQRGVDVVHGTAVFTSPHSVRVEGPEGPIHIRFQHAIIAAGSQATQIPAFPNDDPRLMDSTDALELDTIPERLLVVGGGIIGLEMATVFAALGTRVTVVELLDGL